MLIEPLFPSTAQPALTSTVRALRPVAVAALQAASRQLLRLASHVAAAPERTRSVALAPVIEFHAEAGAPEGALYVDGRLVAFLPGVSRL